MNGSNYLLKMAFPCRGGNCKKLFSTKSNRNRHKKLKNHGPQLEEKLRSRASTTFTVVRKMAATLSPNINITLLNI